MAASVDEMPVLSEENVEGEVGSAGSGSASGSRINSRKKKHILGSVVFADRCSGKCKYGVVLPDGKIWHEQEGTFDSTLDWLDAAPFQDPSKGMKEMSQVAREATEIAAEEEVFDEMPRGRRRSRSVQSPPGGGHHYESVSSLKTLDDEWNDWYSENESSSEELDGKYGSNFMMATRLVFGTKCDRICIYQGNPTCLAGDSIVRSTRLNLLDSNRGNFWELAIARAGIRLALSCESILSKESSRMLKDGTTVVTPAFDLPCRYIIHIATASEPIPFEQLCEYYSLALKQAERERVDSLVMCMVGDEEFCSGEESARALIQTLQMECQDPESSFWNLDRLVLACYTQEDMVAVHKSIAEAAEHNALFSN